MLMQCQLKTTKNKHLILEGLKIFTSVFETFLFQDTVPTTFIAAFVTVRMGEKFI